MFSKPTQTLLLLQLYATAGSQQSTCLQTDDASVSSLIQVSVSSVKNDGRSNEVGKSNKVHQTLDERPKNKSGSGMASKRVWSWMSSKGFALSQLSSAPQPSLSILFLTAVQSILEAMVIICIGIWLTKCGIMPPDKRTMLAHISMNITIPCLLFHSVVAGFDRQVLSQAWPMALFPLIYVSIGLLIGMLVVAVGNPPPDFVRGTIAAIAFGTSTGMPVVLLQVVKSSIGSTLNLSDTDPMIFLSVYLMTYPVLQWAVGGALLKAKSPDDAGTISLNAIPAADDLDLDLHDVHCSTPAIIEAASKKAIEEAVDSATPSTAPCCLNGLQDVLANMLAPPVVAALLGMIIALTPLRSWLIKPGAPLAWLFAATEMVGAAAAPLNLFVLGGSLGSGTILGVVSKRLLASIVLGKMLLMPLVGMAVTTILGQYISICSPQDDMFWLVAMIVTCTPTANNIVILTEIGGENKQAMSSTILVEYICAPFLVTLTLMLCVQRASGWNHKGLTPTYVTCNGFNATMH